MTNGTAIVGVARAAAHYAPGSLERRNRAAGLLFQASMEIQRACAALCDPRIRQRDAENHANEAHGYLVEAMDLAGLARERLEPF